jgi:7-carboxy-7-deazaguanine synthase
VAREEDLGELQALAAELDAPPEKICLMPEGVSADILSERGVWVAEICKQYGYRFSPRLHVYLWGARRGV